MPDEGAIVVKLPADCLYAVLQHVLGTASLRHLSSRNTVMARLKLSMRWLMGILFVLAGANHFLNPGFYVRIMPSYLPWHLELVYLSGLVEIALGVALLIPASSRLAAWALIGLLVVFLSVHVHMLVNAQRFPEVHIGVLWGRLAFQGLFIAWTYWFTK